MSYLDLPRIHFLGEFCTNPATMNNNDKIKPPKLADPDEGTTSTNMYNTSKAGYPTYPYAGGPNGGDVPADKNLPNGLIDREFAPQWNPMGTAKVQTTGHTQTGEPINPVLITAFKAEDEGLIGPGSTDPLIGATLDLRTPNSSAPKIVDLDTQQQFFSTFYGLGINLTAADGTVLLETRVDEFLVPPTLTDISFDIIDDQGNRTAGCCMETVVRPEQFRSTNGVSPLFDQFMQSCAEGISIKFQISMNLATGYDINSPRFTIGPIMGTFGPAKFAEPERCSAPRRFVQSSGNETYKPGFFKVDSNRNKLVIDLGNSVLKPYEPGALYAGIMNNGPDVTPLTNDVNLLDNYADVYENQAGIVEVDISDQEVTALSNADLGFVANPGGGQQNTEMRECTPYVNLSEYFTRLPLMDSDSTTSTSVDLIARQYGEPLPNESLNVELIPGNYSEYGHGIPLPPGKGGSPLSPESLLMNGKTKSTTVMTGTNGVGQLNLSLLPFNASVLTSTSRQYIGSTLYHLSGDWATRCGLNWGWFGAAYSVLAWPTYNIPSQPDWDTDVLPVMNHFMSLYPGMKKIKDFSDYQVVANNHESLRQVFTLAGHHPHYMPVSRDMHPAKRAMVVKWIDQNF